MIDKSMIAPDWRLELRKEFLEPYWGDLQSFLRSEQQLEQTIYPPKELVFVAINRVGLADIKVVILGQEPYDQPGQANGMAFSVQKGVVMPPSLRNIAIELRSDTGDEMQHGDLSTWCDQGVLLLNSSLTVRKGEPNSHQGMGWEILTDEIIHKINDNTDNVVFILWGKNAQEKSSFIDTKRHLVLKAPNPSPFSASSGFLGSKPFSKTNKYLIEYGLEPINWEVK